MGIIFNRVKEAKERLAGCTCSTCKFFYPVVNSVRQAMGFKDSGVCTKKHKGDFNLYLAQKSTSDLADDYCVKYRRGNAT